MRRNSLSERRDSLTDRRGSIIALDLSDMPNHEITAYISNAQWKSATTEMRKYEYTKEALVYILEKIFIENPLGAQQSLESILDPSIPNQGNEIYTGLLNAIVRRLNAKENGQKELDTLRQKYCTTATVSTTTTAAVITTPSAMPAPVTSTAPTATPAPSADLAAFFAGLSLLSTEPTATTMTSAAATTTVSTTTPAPTTPAKGSQTQQSDREKKAMAAHIERARRRSSEGMVSIPGTTSQKTAAQAKRLTNPDREQSESSASPLQI